MRQHKKNATLTTLVIAISSMVALPAMVNGQGCNATVSGGDSIQTAINNANSGDTICVEAGTYNETLSGFKNGISLVGEGSGLVTIDVAGSPTNRGIEVDSVDNITLQGFTVQNSDDGDYGLKIQFVDGLEVKDVVAKDNGKTGIDLNTVDNATLNNVRAHGNDAAGIALRNGENIVVDGAEISNNVWGGLALWAPSGEALTGVKITESTFSNESAAGVFAQYPGPFDVDLMHNTFTDNTVAFILDDQFGPPDATGFSLNSNNIEDNGRGVVNDGIETLDAVENWWGHASGPGGPDGRVNATGKIVGQGDTIEGDVDFEPWLSREVGSSGAVIIPNRR